MVGQYWPLSLFTHTLMDLETDKTIKNRRVPNLSSLHSLVIADGYDGIFSSDDYCSIHGACVAL